MSQKDKDSDANASKESPLSLGRLRTAFAAMLGERGSGNSDHGTDGSTELRSRDSPKLGNGSYEETALRGCEINPRSIVEAILFVGRPDNGSLSSRELAAAMRGVSPAEIDAVVRELNTVYDGDETAYRIEGASNGYRLTLRAEFERLRDKFYGRVRESRLSPAGLEVLSVVAYHQPVTADEIQQLRGAPGGAALATLVRRRLVKLDRPHAGVPAHYSTTERFLNLFGLENLAALPRSEELEKL